VSPCLCEYGEVRREEEVVWRNPLSALLYLLLWSLLGLLALYLMYRHLVEEVFRWP
jgi:hypothetical protein